MTKEQKTEKLISEIKEELERLYFRSPMSLLVKFAYEYAVYDTYWAIHRDNYDAGEIDAVWLKHCKPFIDCVAKMINEKVSCTYVYSTDGVMVAMRDRNVINQPCVIEDVDWDNEKITINYDAVANYVEAQIVEEYAVA